MAVFDEQGFSQSALTIPKNIMYQYKKPTNSSVANRRNLKHREAPLLIYVGLKLYATVRENTLI